MTFSTTARRISVVLLSLGLLFTAGCGSDDAAGNSTDSSTSDSTSNSDSTGGDGDYAFGTDRDQMREAIDTAFSSQGGKSTWDGDTLVLTIDGDADSVMAGFTQCRVLDELLTEDDSAVIAFPNGKVNCADVLPNE